MSKMTDEQIKKALECCIKLTSDCDICPYYGYDDDLQCFDMSKRDALDLINRQQSAIDVYMQENDRLKTAYIQVSMDRDEAKAEIEGLQKLLYSFLDTRNGDLVRITNTKLEVIKKPIKAEAIKEFVQRLKEQITTRIVELKATKSKYVKENYKCLSCDYIAKIRGEIEFLESLKEFIDNLVEEMVGEGK